MCRSEMKSAATRSYGLAAVKGPQWSRSGNALDSLDHHRLHRGVLEHPMRGRRDIADLIDHIHALNDLAEDRIAPARLIGIEGLIVVQVHIELNVAAVRLLAAGHAHGT